MIPDAQIDALAARVRALSNARGTLKWRELQGLLERASNAQMARKSDEAIRWWEMAEQTVSELEKQSTAP